MKSLLASLMLATSSLAVAGCASGPSEAEMTPLELQSIQSRSFPEDKSVVFPSVISVFQDLGYTIEQADLETGFISATSTTAKSGVVTAILTGSSTTSKTGATAFVEQIGSESRVRLNFVLKKDTTFKYGIKNSNDKAVIEAEPYQSAFEKIETAVFVRSSI